MSKDELVEVTQADRDYVIKLLNHAFRNEDISGISVECFDDIAEAFARHRTTTERAVPEREAKVVEEPLYSAHTSCGAFLAQAIRGLQPVNKP